MSEYQHWFLGRDVKSIFHQHPSVDYNFDKLQLDYLVHNLNEGLQLSV